METAQTACAKISTPGKTIGAPLPRTAIPLREDPEFAAAVIARLFRRFDGMFPGKWSKSWKTTEERTAAMDCWTMELQDMSCDAINFGVEMIKEDGDDWPPSSNHFYALCRNYVPPVQQRIVQAPLLEAKPSTDTEIAMRHKAIMRGMFDGASDRDRKAFEEYEKTHRRKK